MLKISMVELCATENKGSIGCHYIVDALRRKGFTVDILDNTEVGYDVELMSIHHCSNFPLVIEQVKHAPLRIIGGHPMQNNPRPVIRYCDAVFCGEGEIQIIAAMNILKEGGSITDVFNADPRGWILSSDHSDGDTLPEPHYEKTLPTDNPVYLNYEGTRSASWYIEAARGCPFKCTYCELGNSSPYRKHDWSHVKKLVEKVDTKKAKKINLFAPDEAALPFYDDFLSLIHSKKMNTNFSSMHFKTIKKTSHKFKKNHLFRLGLDGMTEKTRFRVGKKIKDIDVIRFFMNKTEEGYVRFKLFMIWGYPWDTLADFDEFEAMMDGVFRLRLPKNVSLRIKWTPFIPQPCTPLGRENVTYQHDLYERIMEWHEMAKTPRYGKEQTGIYIQNDGIMGEARHKREVALTRGDENVLKN